MYIWSRKLKSYVWVYSMKPVTCLAIELPSGRGQIQ